jgi:hypothetical protein
MSDCVSIRIAKLFTGVGKKRCDCRDWDGYLCQGIGPFGSVTSTIYRTRQLFEAFSQFVLRLIKKAFIDASWMRFFRVKIGLLIPRKTMLASQDVPAKPAGSR